MKALSRLQSAINQGSGFALIALITIAPYVYPSVAHAQLQTSGQSAVVFTINTTLQNQNSLSFNQTIQTDPLAVDLKDYLDGYDSPLANYVPQLLTKNNWKTVLAISFVESNFCVHHLNNNCSGIGGPGHFEKYKDFGGWIDRMSDLLATHYDGWSLDKMNGIYVQPKSPNWAYGSKKIFAELTDLENKAQAERASILINSPLAYADSQTDTTVR